MDSGEDSPSVGVIILIVAFAINAAIYAGFGLLLIALIDACRGSTGKRSLLK